MKKIILTVFALFITCPLCSCEQLADAAGLRESGIFHYQPYQENGWQEALANERQLQLASAIEAYYLTFNHYPAELTELVESGIATKEEISSPLGTAFYYRRLLVNKGRNITNKQPVAWTMEKNY